MNVHDSVMLKLEELGETCEKKKKNAVVWNVMPRGLLVNL
jgi:hypothetical protein